MTEKSKLEQAFIALLGNEGYPHHLGITISRREKGVVNLNISQERNIKV